MKYYVSLPKAEAHSNHPLGSEAIYSQKMHPEVSRKIFEMVSSGIIDAAEVRRSLCYFVDHFLCKELGMKPLPHDRAFYPLKQDILNHISAAKKSIDFSKLDQENLRLKVEHWKSINKTSSYYFRPFEKGVSEHESILVPGKTLLYAHQEEWQKELLLKYGNVITLMDATYKTTKYSIPLFFLCVKTNVNYTVVAEFVIQSETTDLIFEALSIIKSWNPAWNPNFFITDYSDAEMSAINRLLPDTKLYLCDFHREQAWERWVKDKSHGLGDIEAASLLDLLRDCANAPVNLSTQDPSDHIFKLALHRLKASDVWKKHSQVQQWLNAQWLACPEQWVRAYRDLSYHAAVNTTNGVESQNKLLKYSYLPRRSMTLSRLAAMLCEEFIPDIYHKYLFLNYKMSPSYRTYNDFVPSYLHGCPRKVILHCLERRSNSRKYELTDITQYDDSAGVFTIKGSSNNLYTVNFGISTNEPSCTCPDWLQWRIPCKHFFAIFRLFDMWGWNSLPEQFKKQPHISSSLPAVVSTMDCNDISEVNVSYEESVFSEILPTKQPSQSTCLRRQRQSVRVALKELESLAFDINDANVLESLHSDLKALKQKHQQSTCTENGLVLCQYTCSGERARKLKMKYKRLKKRTSPYHSLDLQQRSGRPRSDYRHRNRVGAKAAKLRKQLQAVPAPSLKQDVDSQSDVQGCHKHKRGRCGTCEGCLRDDCGQCPQCLDKKKFGGPGKKKKACKLKKCSGLFSQTEQQQSSLKFKSRKKFLQAVGSAEYCLPPGVTLPKHLTPCHPSPHLLNRDDFLHSQARKCHPIVADGNCMFRAFSHQLYGTEDHHCQVRQSLYSHLTKNWSKYEEYWIDSTTTYSNHLLQIKNLGSWGTELELKAFCDYFSLPLFVCSPDAVSRAYKWERFSPPSGSTSKISTLPFTSSHIEIAHSSTRDHYDSIVPYNSPSLLSMPIFRTKVVASMTLTE